MNRLKVFWLSCRICLKNYSHEAIFTLFIIAALACVAAAVCSFYDFHYQDFLGYINPKDASPSAHGIPSSAEGADSLAFGRICEIVELVANALFFLTVLLAYAALKKNQSLFEAEMIFKYDKSYASQKMCDALWVLGNFRREPNNKYFFSEYRKSDRNPKNGGIFTADDKYRWDKEVDDARRLVKMYFLNPYNMYMQGKISRSVFRCIVDKYGLPIFFEVVEKMEFLSNKEYEHEKFYYVMLLAGDIYEKHHKAISCYQSTDYIKRFPRREPIGCKVLRKLLRYCEKKGL